MQKELIYERMNGFLEDEIFLIPKKIAIEDEFAEGKECFHLYEKAYLKNLLFRLFLSIEGREGIEFYIRRIS